MAANYNKSLLKDYKKSILETEKLSNVVKYQNDIIKELHTTINNLINLLAKKDEQINKLILEIERLKNNNDKDSSNSGKPPSTNGFKKVVQNNST